MVAITRSVGGVWRKKVGTIVSSGTVVIDTIPLNSFRSLQYIITGYNVANDLGLTEYYSILKESGSLKSTVHGKLGKLKLAISESIIAGNVQLSITNNEAFTVQIQIASLKLGV